LDQSKKSSIIKIVIVIVVLVAIYFIVNSYQQPVGRQVTETDHCPICGCVYSCSQSYALCFRNCEGRQSCIDECDRRMLGCVQNCGLKISED